MFIFITSAGAQSFMFYRGPQPLEDNAEFTVSTYEVYFEEDGYVILTLDPDLHLKNITGQDLQTTVAQTILDGPLDDEAGYLSFCFFDCVTGNLDKTKTGVMKANSFNEGFHVNFFAYQGKYNRIKVKYEVYLTNDLKKSDKKTVTVTYVYDQNSTTHSSKPDIQPKFAVFQDGNQVTINYSLLSTPCQLEIYHLMGYRIAGIKLPSNQGVFSMPEIVAKGVYICVIKSGTGKRNFLAGG